jgi:uncharacterized membrane protein
MENAANPAQVQSISQQITYSGPLPTSSEFAQYDKTLPGAADRILALAEKQVETRLDNESAIVNATIEQSRRGQFMAFGISVLSLRALGLSIYFDKPTAAIAPTLIALVGLASAFNNPNREKKQK